MSNTPPMANTTAPAMLALAGLNMYRVLPVTVADRPFVAGIDVGWDSLVWSVVGGFGVRSKVGSAHQRPRWRTCGMRAIALRTAWRASGGAGSLSDSHEPTARCICSSFIGRPPARRATMLATVRPPPSRNAARRWPDGAANRRCQDGRPATRPPARWAGRAGNAGPGRHGVPRRAGGSHV